MTDAVLLHPVSTKKPRISAKLRRAIDLRVRRGLTIAQACEEAEISQSGWHAAMKRKAVQEALSETQMAFVQEAENLRATAKALAVQVAMDLIQNAKSETVRARMVEFLLSDGKGQGTQIAVNVDARHVPTRGYEFAPFGATVEGTAEVNK